jgi:hypothetical protein
MGTSMFSSSFFHLAQGRPRCAAALIKAAAVTDFSEQTSRCRIHWSSDCIAGHYQLNPPVFLAAAGVLI